ncbi:hypothetical protein [Mucilaginibacter sp. PAMB04168]|uniref:hypothetical protein n=1 Tax=Mucilaginibacter sp. PAMB04168 TaxID=3138567 RepID=UPI0031F6C6B3
MPRVIVLTEAPDNRRIYFNVNNILYFYEVPDFDGNVTKVFTGDSNYDVMESAETIRELVENA